MPSLVAQREGGLIRAINRWEFSVTESRRELWRIQSIDPPLVGSKEMKLWIDAGKAIPWEGVENS